MTANMIKPDLNHMEHTDASYIASLVLPDDNLSPKAIQICEPLLQAILLEVCTYPKPGLVTPISNGSHRDMNLYTFIMSSAAIYPCFSLCAQAGLNFTGDLPDLLKLIRPIGIKYEKYLMQTTGGVNTQKGALFLASILAAAAGYVSSQNQKISVNKLVHTVRQMCSNLCQKDFADLKFKKTKTNGEKLFLDYGLTGVRGEAELGFPTVINYALPSLIEAFEAKLPLRESLVHCLISIIAYCDDTTILARSDLNSLRMLQQKALNIIEQGGMKNEKSASSIIELDKWCCELNISPGGCADLLSITIGIYLLCNGRFPLGIR